MVTGEFGPRPPDGGDTEMEHDNTVRFGRTSANDDVDDVDDELGVPLVLCRSRGGPFDDEAFRSGWRLGEISSTLGRVGISAVAESIRPWERLQADLLAMAHGYTMTIQPSGDPEWLAVTFTRARDVA
jgi:hypothetical protein